METSNNFFTLDISNSISRTSSMSSMSSMSSISTYNSSSSDYDFEFIDDNFIFEFDYDESDFYQELNSIFNSINKNLIISTDFNDPNNDICSLCGFHLDFHHNKTHRYIRILEEYRCIKCNKFFFQHNHKKCFFKPSKYIIP
jgi:hypothetical protein